MEDKKNVSNHGREIECEICFVEYDSQYVVPKMLKCGHTFCEVCVKDLLYKSPYCPSCRLSINEKETVKNYALLKLIPVSNPKNKSKVYADIRIRLEGFRRELELQRDFSVKCKEMHTNNICLIDTSICQIDELLGGKPEDLDRDSSLHIFNEVKKILKTFSYDKKPVPKLFATPLSDFRNYILKIYRRIESDGKLLSVHQPNYENKLVYGKVSNWSNALCFHCLCLKDAGDCQEFLKFDDLKKITPSVKLRIFLKIPCKTQANKILMIEPYPSPLLSQFIRLCTGETGFSYREASFVKGIDKDKYSKSILKVSQYRDENINLDDNIGNDDYDKGKIDYAFESKSDSVFKEPTAVVIGSADGGFQIFHSYSKAYYKNVIGVVENPTDLKDIVSCDGEKDHSTQKILDCGLAFEL